MCGIYGCNKCSWKGSHAEVEYDKVDTCFGNDSINMCPACGSYEVAELNPGNTIQN